MKGYVDGFVFVVPSRKLKAYQKIAAAAGKIWMDHGALQYVECVGQDMKVMAGMLSFPKLTKLKTGEKACFSWIFYKNKKHRDAVNKKVMADPRMEKMQVEMKDPPFDMKRMAYGGFETMVNL